MSSIKRRHFLLSLLTSVLLPYLLIKQPSDASTQAMYDPDRPLKERARSKGLLFGAYPQDGYRVLLENPHFRDAFIQNCGLLVGGFSWWWNRPTTDDFDFTEMDAIHEFAMTHNIQFQGGALVWHQFLPTWLEDKLKNDHTPRSELENLFTNYIATTIQRYRGKAHSWSIVNEAIEIQDGREDGLRVTPWLKRLGEDYIDLAFRTAAAANPDIPLFYNDYGLEFDNTESEAKRKATLKLLERLKARDVPIHALGVQSHLTGDRDNVNFNGLRSFLKDVANLGLKIFISELDVSDRNLPDDIDTRDRLVASTYENYLSVLLAEPAVELIITWGLSDRYTWLSYQEPRPDRLPVRPLPLDESMNRKLAWNAIARAIDDCPDRQTWSN
jgi:endo-1,4-beta-xylanase